MNIKDIELKFKNRAVMAFERLTGKIFALESNTDFLIYYYAVVVSSAPDIELSFDEFIELTDEDDSIIEYISAEFMKHMKSRVDNTPKEGEATGKK